MAIQEVFEGRQPVTYVMLTLKGHQGLDEHWNPEPANREPRPFKV